MNSNLGMTMVEKGQRQDISVNKAYILPTLTVYIHASPIVYSHHCRHSYTLLFISLK